MQLRPVPNPVLLHGQPLRRVVSAEEEGGVGRGARCRRTEARIDPTEAPRPPEALPEMFKKRTVELSVGSKADH